MIRKRITLTLIIILLVFGPFGCATLGERWGDLSQDDKCRIILADFQGQLTTLFDAGEKFVSLNPWAVEAWRAKIVPAFKLANEAIKRAMIMGQAGDYSPTRIYEEIGPLIELIEDLLVGLGAIKVAERRELWTLQRSY